MTRKITINDITEDTARKFLIGSILGDMCLEKNKNIKARYDIVNTQSIIHEDYVQLKYSIFSKFWNCGKIGISNNWGSNPDPNLRKAKRFRIYEADLIEYILNVSYKDGRRKILDKELLSPEVMFFWYLDDGSLINGRCPSLRIGLKSFPDEEILRFIKDFNDKYDIEFIPEKPKSIGKITRVFLNGQLKILKFLELLEPFYDIIPKSLEYKFSPIIKNSDLREKYKRLIKNEVKK